VIPVFFVVKFLFLFGCVAAVLDALWLYLLAADGPDEDGPADEKGDAADGRDGAEPAHAG